MRTVALLKRSTSALNTQLKQGVNEMPLEIHRDSSPLRSALVI